MSSRTCPPQELCLPWPMVVSRWHASGLSRWLAVWKGPQSQRFCQNEEAPLKSLLKVDASETFHQPDMSLLNVVASSRIPCISTPIRNIPAWYVAFKGCVLKEHASQSCHTCQNPRVQVLGIWIGTFEHVLHGSHFRDIPTHQIAIKVVHHTSFRQTNSIVEPGIRSNLTGNQIAEMSN